MRAAVRWLLSTFAVVTIVGSALPVQGQVFVYPRRPGKSNPRYFEFKWRWLNVLTSPEADIETLDPGPRGGADLISSATASPGDEMNPTYPPLYPSGHHQLATPYGGASGNTGGKTAKTTQSSEAKDGDDGPAKLRENAGGFRLYFYESERDAAQRAVATIERQYRQLADYFDFVPPKTFPFILYNSYTEFLQTNLFPIQEGTLGVTSPRNLKLTLPYFGDHRQFARVSIHELVHQFTIQKVRVVAADEDAVRNPLEQMPLWFIEGLAEYYTHGGMDPETSMLIRDLTVHQAPRRGYVLGDFFDTGPYSFLWIYKMGQARCVFLEETYGSGILQRILDTSYLLGRGSWQKDKVDSFSGLLSRLTGDSPKKIEAKFDEWLKRRAYKDYLETSQGPKDLERLTQINRILRGLDTSPGGNILMYKSISRTTGRNRLFLADRRDLGSEKPVAADGKPGLVSLHPLQDRNFDVGKDELVYVGRAKGYDRIFRRQFTHEWSGSKTKAKKSKKAKKEDTAGDQEDKPSATFRFGDREVYELRKADIVAAEAIALSPDDDRVAFVGLHEDGIKDLFVLDPAGDDFEITRITDTIAAERGLDWGPDGLVYTSDRTGHGKYNIFRIAPEAGAEPTRLTSQPTDQFDPVVTKEGKVVFVAYDRDRANLHVVGDGGSTRRTDISTGFFNPSPGPDGSLWALHHYAGRRVPARITSEHLQDFDSDPASPDVPAVPPASQKLSGDRDYKPLALRNWTIDNGIGILGISGDGIYGQLYASASDLLRNDRLVLDLVAFGDFQRTDGSLTYINQSGRVSWGLSIFQDFQFRVDETFDNVEPFISYDRFYGARGLVRYPFNEFTYLQFSGGLGGVSYFLSEGGKEFLRDETPLEAERPLDKTWKVRNDGPRLQSEASVGFGFDTIRYHRQTGPLSGGAFLATVTGDWQPLQDVAFANLRLDGEYYLPIYDRINAFIRIGTGGTFGGRFARQYFLSSFYTLRGVPFGETDFLLGRNFLFSTLEFQFPLNFIVSIPFLDLEGVVGADFGGVGDGIEGAWENRVFDLAAGVNFGFGPIVLRLHFAKPFDIGAPVPNNGDWVPNFSIGWRYL